MLSTWIWIHSQRSDNHHNEVKKHPELENSVKWGGSIGLYCVPILDYGFLLRCPMSSYISHGPFKSGWDPTCICQSQQGSSSTRFVGLCASQNGEKLCLAALRFLAEYASKFQDNYVSFDNKSNTRRNFLSVWPLITFSPG